MADITLHYKEFGKGFPLIILHGLLGSLDNWQTVGKKLSDKFRVFILDQRNHGKSPHSDEFDYDLLSQDLLHFLNQQQIEKAHLMGHSMGGKAVMNFALKHPERVEKLIVVDIAPSAFTDHHSHIFNALMSVDVAHASTREQVQEELRGKLNGDEVTVQFLLKGLTRNEGSVGFHWKFNVEALWKNYGSISAAIASPAPFTGETLFIKGEKSNYIHAGNGAEITALFPHYHLEEIKGAGHWVQAENATDFITATLNFLS